MTETRPIAKLGGPDDVLTAVPLILGVQQITDSIVVICLHDPAPGSPPQMLCTMRIDVSEIVLGGLSYIPKETTAAVIVAYDLHKDPVAALGLLAFVTHTPIKIKDALMVNTERGTYDSLMTDQEDQPVPTQATFDNAESLADSGPRIIARSGEEMDHIFDLRPGEPDPLFAGIEARDAYVGAAAKGGGEAINRAYDALFVACRSLPDDHPAVCDHLAAMAAMAYLRGEGMVFNRALSRAERIDPSHTLSMLLASLMRQAIPPDRILELLTSDWEG